MQTPVCKILSSVSFHQYFQVFRSRFNICFPLLMLLKDDLLKKLFNTIIQKFAIRCNQNFFLMIRTKFVFPLVTRNSSGFDVLMFFSLCHRHITYMNEILVYQWYNSAMGSQTYGLRVVSHDNGRIILT